MWDMKYTKLQQPKDIKETEMNKQFENMSINVHASSSRRGKIDTTCKFSTKRTGRD